LLVIGGDPFIEITLGFQRGPTPYAALLITLAKFLEKPVMLHGMHFGRPPQTELGRELTRFCLSNATLITLREESAFKNFQSFGVDHPSVVALADTAFGLNPIEGKEAGQKVLDEEGIRFSSERVIGVTFRHMYWKWNAGKWASYSSMVAEVCDWLVDKMDADILFIPNCTYDTDYEYEDDRAAARDIAARMSRQRRAHRIQGKPNLFETLALYRQIDMMFSNRRHGLVFAAIQGIPALVCGEELHTRPMMEALSLGEMFVSENDFNADLFKQNIGKIWEERESIKARIREVLPDLRTRALRHADLAANLIRGGK